MSLENPFYNQSRDEKLEKEEAEIREKGGENIQRNNNRLICKIFKLGTEGGKNFKRALRALTVAVALSPFAGEMGRADAGWFLPSKEVATHTLEEEDGSIAQEWAKRRDADLEQRRSGVGWKEQLDAEVDKMATESKEEKEEREEIIKRMGRENEEKAQALKKQQEEAMKEHYVYGVGKMTQEQYIDYQIKKMELEAQKEGDQAKKDDMYEFIRLSSGLKRHQRGYSKSPRVNLNFNYKSHNK